MTKKIFIEYLKELIRLKKEVERVEDVIGKSPLNDNLLTIAFASGYYEELILNILKDAMDDTFDYIGYFIYEMDMKFTKKEIVKDENGKNIPLRNFNDLYNAIINK